MLTSYKKIKLIEKYLNEVKELVLDSDKKKVAELMQKALIEFPELRTVAKCAALQDGEMSVAALTEDLQDFAVGLKRVMALSEATLKYIAVNKVKIDLHLNDGQRRELSPDPLLGMDEAFIKQYFASRDLSISPKSKDKETKSDVEKREEERVLALKRQEDSDNV